jgi:hypothetical protein
MLKRLDHGFWRFSMVEAPAGGASSRFDPMLKS